MALGTSHPFPVQRSYWGPQRVFHTKAPYSREHTGTCSHIQAEQQHSETRVYVYVCVMQRELVEKFPLGTQILSGPVLFCLPLVGSAVGSFRS